MKVLSLTLALLWPLAAFGAKIQLHGSSDQGFPDIAYNPTKPPSASAALGTAFPEPTSGGSITRTFRVENQDTAFGDKLILSAVSSDPRFVISGLASQVGRAASDEYEITFTPTDTSPVDATITFTSNDPARPTYAFHVSGAPGSYSARFENQAGDEITKFGPGANTPIILTDTYFGSVARGGAAVSKTYHLVNTGSLPIDFLEVRLSGDGAYSSPTLGADHVESTTVAPGAVYPVEIVMSTAAVLDDGRADLTAASNEISSGVIGFSVAGDVTGAPGIVIERLAGSWGDTGGSDDFGNVAAEPGFSVTRSYRVRNTGETALTISDVQVTDPDPDFQITGLGTGTLAPGASDTFNVTFTPTKGGLIDSVLAITSDAVEGPVTTLTLTGTGVLPPSPELTIGTYLGEPGSGTLVSFGAVPARHDVVIDDFVDETIAIRNTGNAPASLDALVLSEGYAVVGPPPASVGAGATVYLTVRFQPEAIGFHPLTLEVTSSDLAEPLVATRENRGQGLPRAGEVGMEIVSVGEETVELLVDPTPLGDQASFRIGGSATMQAWGISSPPLILSTTTPTPVTVAKSGPRRFFRVERIGPLE